MNNILIKRIPGVFKARDGYGQPDDLEAATDADGHIYGVIRCNDKGWRDEAGKGIRVWDGNRQHGTLQCDVVPEFPASYITPEIEREAHEMIAVGMRECQDNLPSNRELLMCKGGVYLVRKQSVWDLEDLPKLEKVCDVVK